MSATAGTIDDYLATISTDDEADDITPLFGKLLYSLG